MSASATSAGNHVQPFLTNFLHVPMIVPSLILSHVRRRALTARLHCCSLNRSCGVPALLRPTYAIEIPFEFRSRGLGRGRRAVSATLQHTSFPRISSTLPPGTKQAFLALASDFCNLQD